MTARRAVAPAAKPRASRKTPARAARPRLVAPPPAPSGNATRTERAESPWLGRRTPPTPEFQRALELERSLQALWPAGLPNVAPATVGGAFFDWALHLAASPAKQWELQGLALQSVSAWWNAALQPATPSNRWCVDPMPQDKRFRDDGWRQWPYALVAQAFLLRQAWWERATTGVPGVTRHHEEMVNFAARQWLDMVSPSNSLANPEVLRRTLEEGGMNLWRGALHLLRDLQHEATDQPPEGAERYRPGIEVATTPGRVVLRNALMELIQYAPTTSQVRPEPVLIVPAWIMKYYVLDLEPHNSLVKYLLDQGFSVFAISWKNPGPAERDFAMADYAQLGVRAALEAIGQARPQTPVHAVGYCLGGTLLSMVAAALGREGGTPLQTLTLLAAQTDFTDPGEISLFIDESQVTLLEAQMARTGYLDKRQMRDTFQMLRSRDLIWSYRLRSYLLGDDTPMSALMAWNADGTRLPARMHSEYLRALYLDNALARGEYRLGGVPINLADIHVPVFSVGTVQDHVAPWRSVFKLQQFTDAPLTFLLTAGGHNVGIVNPPGSPRAGYRMRSRASGDRLLTPDEWLAETSEVTGSWWAPWVDWLGQHSSALTRPPALLPSLGPAPGEYVHEK